jgi:hypothetical protein
MMTMKTRNAWLLGMAVIAGVVGVVLTGCETTESANSSIAITLSSSTITNKAAVTMTAAASGGTNSTTSLALPLVWTASDAALGGIKSSAGVTAIYQSTGKVGNNVITVRDQGESEGIAVITQQ